MRQRIIWSFVFTVPLFYIAMGRMLGFPHRTWFQGIGTLRSRCLYKISFGLGHGDVAMAILKSVNQQIMYAHIRSCVRESLHCDEPNPKLEEALHLLEKIIS